MFPLYIQCILKLLYLKLFRLGNICILLSLQVEQIVQVGNLYKLMILYLKIDLAYILNIKYNLHKNKYQVDIEYI